ncbi:MAG TPA: TRAP transporter small permease [Desulfotomaculum sp.]|nr:TRAP transporter small permease [Desulfofundulus thermobenzoicus]HHW43510.1 TRAP transporter small permease [Desulfotomaculum sp.]
MKIVKAVGKAVDFIEWICMTCSVISVLVMMLLVTADVVGRKFFHHPIPGSVEINEEYVMIALVYLAMSYVYKEGGHVRVTLFRHFIPGPVKTVVDTGLNILGLLFFALIVLLGWQTSLRAIRFQETSSCLLAYPMAPAYLILTLGAALLCIRILETIVSPRKIKWE